MKQYNGPNIEIIEISAKDVLEQSIIPDVFGIGNEGEMF